MPLSCRPLEPADAAALAAFLELGMPFDAFLLDALGAAGVAGFLGAFDGARLVGVVIQRRGTVCAASRTPPAIAAAMTSAPGLRDAWTSIVGPEAPCAAIVESCRGPQPFRLDRVQAFMSVTRDAGVQLGGSGVRRATAHDVDALVPIISHYRLEDGLSRPGDDHSAWVRTHALERIQANHLFVVAQSGRIVFTGAFNFAGRAGAGLGGIYTIPEARGRGIAGRATADLCRIALELGPVATLHVDPRNTHAIRAYERAGLKRMGEFRLTFR